MKKFMLALLVSVALLPACCVGHVRHPEAGMNLPEKLEHRTVALVQWIAPDADGDPTLADPNTPGARLVAQCAGVWVSDTQFVTAAHCVEDTGKSVDRLRKEALLELIKRMVAAGAAAPDVMPTLPAWDPVGQLAQYSNYDDIKEGQQFTFRSSHPAVIEAYDENHDLALVRATPNVMDPEIVEHSNAKLANHVHVGDNVNVVGHPSSMWWTYVRGNVAALRPNSKTDESAARTDFLQISSPIWGGDSGGGVWSEAGELLGICKSMHPKMPNVGFFIQYTTVKGFLTLHGVK